LEGAIERQAKTPQNTNVTQDRSSFGHHGGFFISSTALVFA
jgi:hypothetical protein